MQIFPAAHFPGKSHWTARSIEKSPSSPSCLGERPERRTNGLLVIFFLTFSVQPLMLGAEEDFPMLQIMLACTRTGTFVRTGI